MKAGYRLYKNHLTLFYLLLREELIHKRLS